MLKKSTPLTSIPTSGHGHGSCLSVAAAAAAAAATAAATAAASSTADLAGKKIQSGRELSFVLRASSDTLPTEVNLRRWKIQTSAVCCLCSQPNPTTFHVLNGCQEALQQGRFTWRHDCVLSSIVQFLKDNVQDGSTIYADIPGFQATSNPPSTVPPDISLTSARPDIVVINRNKNRVTLGELTVPHNSKQSMCNAKDRKANKPNYLTLIQELGEQFDNVQYVTIEVGSLGHTIQSDFHASLKYLCNANVSKQSLRVIMQDVCKTAITCSQSMFSRRKLSVWSSPPLSFYSHGKFTSRVYNPP
ncbi:uncharacterized protein [Amphiura filiformis]|uniref:uncharacterized protein n=1 Tax=Amphiura filiformis TaxID=82378 RepID=UPI003B2116C0